MKDLRRKFCRLFKLNFLKFWPFVFIFFISILFFYPLLLKNRVPLPLDALVGAHLPWTEVLWEGYPVGVPIKNLEITDSISQFYPWRSLVGRFWREGQFPLWNKYMLCGVPFLATLHSAGLYPLNFLYLILNDIDAWSLLIFLQIFLSGIFMFLFLLELGIDRLSSLFGAIVFSFSGYMIAWLEFATGGHAGLWLPLILMLELKFVLRGERKYYLFIPFIFFFIYTAGDFQIPLYITLVYFLFGIYLIFKNKNLKNKIVLFVKVFFSWVLGVLLSLLQLLPTFELFKNSVRLNDPYVKEYFYGLMSWEKITNFLWPDFYGNVVTGNYWGKYSFHEYLAFTGIVSIGFLIYSFISKKNFLEKFFWFIFIVSLLFLFPTPLAFLPYRYNLPGIGTSFASRIIFLVDFSVAVISSYGLSKWVKRQDGKLGKVFFYILVISFGIALGLIISILILEKGPSLGKLSILTNLKVSLKNMVPSTLILIAGLFVLYLGRIKFLKGHWLYFKGIRVLIILLLAILELLRFSWKNTPFSEKKFLYPKTKVIDFLTSQKKPFRIAGAGFPMNYFMQYDISSVEGYDPLYPSDSALWLSLINTGKPELITRRYGEVSKFVSPLLDYTNAKYVIDYRKNPKNKIPGIEGVYAEGINTERFNKILEEGRVGIFENKTVLPKVWLTTKYYIAKDKDDLFKKVNDLKFSEKKIVLERSINLQIFEKDLNYEISDYNEGFNKISFVTKSTNDALLFLSESYNPGWKAYVDGIRTDILRANYIFQTIFLPKGEHNVEFIYYPESFKIGKKVSLLSFVLIVVLLTYENKKRYH